MLSRLPARWSASGLLAGLCVAVVATGGLWLLGVLGLPGLPLGGFVAFMAVYTGLLGYAMTRWVRPPPTPWNSWPSTPPKRSAPPSSPPSRGTGRLLVEADVDMVAFTGSAAAGADVAARAAGRRVSLELGGNAPALVLPDAPGDTCAQLARACVYNVGQSCAAPARVITLRENYERVVEELTAAARECLAGRDFGPLDNAGQAARYDGIVTASAAGRNFAADIAPRPGEESGFWRPTRILADLPDDDPAVVEEVFGPLLTVQHAEDLDAAVALADGVPQALAASVWTRDLTTGLELAGRLNAGEAWLNCHLVQTAELPHGGRGASGHGTDLSTLALHEYQRPKTVTARLLRDI
ncbi:aldehyde dehydrogenase family protein [Streptomyces sp. NPDC093064]|uniref:aldehyde dehydrogenase family protein n=1 Tax=Streptomyces sp. NPDC093064 TaxID=3366020 RepID=UPI00381B16D1